MKTLWHKLFTGSSIAQYDLDAKKNSTPSFRRPFDVSIQDGRDLAATSERVFTLATKVHMRAATKELEGALPDALLLTGGCALNARMNERED